ncbi:MAG TPA: aminotransferase class V-fold PLP-dependent enzyme [Longimicrobiales bacterium]|nr:aminotransferase class V-fold PLP-dependent enzyme [Longimicrobiales bacterium]
MTDWTAWRDEFPILARRTYLNSCSLGALSHRALASVGTFHENWHEYGASAWYETWVGRLDELRSRVGGMLNARQQDVALCASTSAALATLASSFDYSRRNRIVIAELDFPTVAYQWMERPGVEIVRIPSDDGISTDPQRMAEAVDDRTAIVAISHVYFTTGAIQQTAPIAEAARRHGALFLVDAYQGAGQVPIDVSELGADALVTGPLKWLLGGPGLAYLYVREEWWRQLRPTTTGWFAARDQFAFDIHHFEFKDDARRFELGTPALPTVHSALGGQSIIDEIGVSAIRARNSELTEYLLQRLEAAGLHVRGAATPDARSALVMVRHADPAAAVAHLAAHDVIVDARPGYVRVSPHFYNTRDELDHFVNTLATAPGA